MYQLLAADPKLLGLDNSKQYDYIGNSDSGRRENAAAFDETTAALAALELDADEQRPLRQVSS